MGGKWVKVEENMFHKDILTFKDIRAFCTVETRVGIAIDANKKVVREGHIYSVNHVRLNKNVELVFGIDGEIELEDEGVMMLGGERRFGRYQMIEEVNIPNGGTNMFSSLGITEVNDLTNKILIATGKLNYIGGWDLNRGFHKPMKSFFPAGTIFNERLYNCVEI